MLTQSVTSLNSKDEVSNVVNITNKEVGMFFLNGNLMEFIAAGVNSILSLKMNVTTSCKWTEPAVILA